MNRLYALLVGIDTYAAPGLSALGGCVNDVEDALALLDSRATPGSQLCPLVLRNEGANRAAVVDGLRTHLGRAGRDDTALFWFSGHGSQAAVPEWAWFEEPTGRLQTLVCADSRVGDVPDLWDKELSALLDVVARTAGHVAVVLDSCHSEGATRGLPPRWRAVPAGPGRDRDSLLAEVIRDAPAAPEHVTLSACRRHELAGEASFNGRVNGVFTWSLLRAIRRLGTTASYRDLLAATRPELSWRGAHWQVPQLHPAGSDLIHHTLLGGAVARPEAALEMVYAPDGWQINAGHAHGLPADGTGLRVGVPGAVPPAEADVVRVLTERSIVVPAGGWQPRPDRQFRVTLTAVGRPSTTVAVAGPDGPAVTALRDRISGPYLRPARPDELADLTAEIAAASTRITIRQADRADEHAVDRDRAVAVMEHIARWRTVQDLRNPVSALDDPVTIEIVPALPGVVRAPATGGALSPDCEDVYRLAYRWEETGWVAPEIFIRLHNRSAGELECLLLYLTNRYAVQADLFPVAPIGAGRSGAARRGRRIRAALPADTTPAPGASVTDWLVLVVAERQFSEEPYLLPPLGRPAPVRRDARPVTDAPGGYDWCTRAVRLVTEVPG